MEAGEYALRGGIVDIFPAGEALPVRIDLFGDEIESIRSFDPTTQRSGATVAALVLRPVGEISLDPRQHCTVSQRLAGGVRAGGGG